MHNEEGLLVDYTTMGTHATLLDFTLISGCEAMSSKCVKILKKKLRWKNVCKMIFYLKIHEDTMETGVYQIINTLLSLFYTMKNITKFEGKSIFYF